MVLMHPSNVCRPMPPPCIPHPKRAAAWQRPTTCVPDAPLRTAPSFQATYAVTVEALKHYSVLQPLLERTQLVEQGRGLTHAVALVLAYEVLWGEGLRPVGPAERAVLQRKVSRRWAVLGGFLRCCCLFAGACFQLGVVDLVCHMRRCR